MVSGWMDLLRICLVSQHLRFGGWGCGETRPGAGCAWVIMRSQPSRGRSRRAGSSIVSAIRAHVASITSEG